MGARNYLIEGVSGSGKTTVATELERRGFDVVHGDRVLAYQGDPVSGRPLEVAAVGAERHRFHLWEVARVRALAADRTAPVTFFCGASRNRGEFADAFDAIAVLEIDHATLLERLDGRVGEFGSDPDERALVERLHHSREELPIEAISIDATGSVDDVVDAILPVRREGVIRSARRRTRRPPAPRPLGRPAGGSSWPTRWPRRRRR